MQHDVAVIGLGYVGLTFATALADVGFRVLGTEVREEVVEMTNRGIPGFSEAGLGSVLKHVLSEGRLQARTDLPAGQSADIYVISVGTPLDGAGRVNLEFIRRATRQVAENMGDGALVILRSTVAIGTARDVVAPILSATGRSFQLAMCPERTLEGRALIELRSLPQVIGADDDATRQRAAQFFHRLTPTIVQLGSLEAAEIVKLVDNTYRDIRFGFGNEVARICEAYGVNAMEVINGGKLGYTRTDVAMPGLVGGPCLEKDPHILTQSLEQKGITLDITGAARRVNERQPRETVGFVADELGRRSAGTAPVIAVAGIAFKGIPETDDLRGSMALRVLAELREALSRAQIRAFDPVCTAEQLADAGIGADLICQTLGEAIEGSDCIVIANNHPALGRCPPVELLARMAPRAFVFDYWNHFSDRRPHEVGGDYYAVGNTRAGR